LETIGRFEGGAVQGEKRHPFPKHPLAISLKKMVAEPFKDSPKRPEPDSVSSLRDCGRSGSGAALPK
jgi:hypothetical protein